MNKDILGLIAGHINDSLSLCRFAQVNHLCNDIMKRQLKMVETKYECHTFLHNKKHSNFWRKDHEGHITESGYYKDGNLHGLFETWRYSGCLRRSKQLNYRNGKMHGKCMIFDSDGNLERIVYYKNGVLHGLEQFYHGKVLTSERHYKNGVLHGVSTQYYNCKPITRVKVVEDVFVDGIRHGRHMEWHQNGKLKIKGSYKQNKKHGLWLTWDNQGILELSETYQDGKLHGLCQQWPSFGKYNYVKFMFDQGDCYYKNAMWKNTFEIYE